MQTLIHRVTAFPDIDLLSDITENNKDGKRQSNTNKNVAMD